MNLVWLVLLLILCIRGYTEGVLNPEVVNIGAIFTFSTINGKVAKIAMKAAEQDVNSDPSILGGRKLAITLHDSNYSGFLSIVGGKLFCFLKFFVCSYTIHLLTLLTSRLDVFILMIPIPCLIAALQFMESDTVAIIGPQSAVMAHVLSHLANELHVPLLSFTALDPTLSPLQFPYFIQTAPSDLFQMTAIADMVSYFEWREVIAVYSDDDQSRNGITTLGDKLAERQCKISYKAALPPDPKATRDQVFNELVKVRMMESRVIVLHTLSKTGLLVFDVAKYLGMMESGYVWIASTWLSTILDSTPLSSKTADSIQGVLTLRPHTPDSKKKREFSSRWNHLSNGTIGLNPYGLYAYDTVWMITYALKTFFDQGGTISFSNITSGTALVAGELNLGALSIFDGGQQLLKNILQINRTGLTGPLRFGPDRSPVHPAYEVINVVGTGFRQLGYWSDYSGLSVASPDTLYAKPPNRSRSNQQLYDVLWPGEITKKPRGWVFPNNGRHLRIGVPNRVSYRDFVSKGKDTDDLHGYCIDVFTAAIALLPYAVPYKFVLFGDGLENPNYNQLVYKVASNVSIVLISNIFVIH